MLSQTLLSSVLALALFSPSLAAPVKRANVKRSVTGPAMDGTDFPDPSLISVDGTYYAFASQSGYTNKDTKIQLATSTDFDSWTYTGQDALPDLPSWAKDDGAVWAPDVNQLTDGSFIMYFSATDSASGRHCVGVATSSTIEGPYTSDETAAWACPTSQGGAIDPSGFVDSDGTRYVLYKIDGNELGTGGNCNNGNDPVVSTPIMIQQVDADGVTMVGDPAQLFTNDAADGPDVEAPSMVKGSDGTYIVFFSSNCYSGSLYDVSYAYSSSPTSGFTKSTTPLFVTGDDGLTGPGGADIDADGVHMLIHGEVGTQPGLRELYAVTVSISGSTVTNA